MRIDKRMLEDMHLASLVGYEVISMKDLEGFSDETKEIIERMLR